MIFGDIESKAKNLKRKMKNYNYYLRIQESVFRSQKNIKSLNKHYNLII